LLEEIGLEGQRIQMINVSSAMGGQFAWSSAELTEEIRRLGPNPLRNGKDGRQETSLTTHPGDQPEQPDA